MEDNDDDDDNNNNNTEETSRASMTTTLRPVSSRETKKAFVCSESSFVRWCLFFPILSTFFNNEKGLKKSFFPFVLFRVLQKKKRRRRTLPFWEEEEEEKEKEKAIDSIH